MKTEDNKGVQIKSMVDDLLERVNSLKNFDHKNEIHVYCDDLAGQVIMSVESMIKAINKLQEHLLAEIDSYRQRLVDISASPSSGQGEKVEEKARLEQELASLAKEVDEFDSACCEYIEGTRKMNEETFRATKRKADEFKQRAKRMRTEMRQQTFDGGFLKLTEGLFFKPYNRMFPKLETFSRDVDAEPKIKHQVLVNKVPTNSKMAGRLFYGRSIYRSIHSLLQLADGNFAVGHNNQVTIVELEAREILYTLKRDEDTVSFEYSFGRGLAQLQNGNLAAVTLKNEIVIWDLENRKLVKTIKFKRKDVNKFHSLESIVSSPNDLLICNFQFFVLVVDPARKHERASFSGFPPCYMNRIHYRFS